MWSNKFLDLKQQKKRNWLDLIGDKYEPTFELLFLLRIWDPDAAVAKLTLLFKLITLPKLGPGWVDPTLMLLKLGCLKSLRTLVESVVISSNANIRFDLRIVLLDEFRAMLVLPPRKKKSFVMIKNCNWIKDLLQTLKNKYEKALFYKEKNV